METRQLGGLGFVICNAALFTNGLIANRFADTPEARKAGAGRMLSGAMWEASSVFLAKYGDRSVADQQTRLQEKLCHYLQQHGVPLDAESLRYADTEKRDGWHKKIEDFLYAHPIEIANAYNALAGIGFAVSGFLRHRAGDKQTGLANLGVSAAMITGALASIIIPEKTPEQIAAKGQTGTLWGKMQEHPLSFVRWIFLGGDVVDGLGAIGEFKRAKATPHGEPYRTGQFAMSALTTTAMVTSLASDWITSGSKKAAGEPKEREAAQQKILDEAARHIATLPPAEQPHLAQLVAEYLTHEHELRFSDRNTNQLTEELLQRVQALASLPAPEKAHTTITAKNAQAERLTAQIPAIHGTRA